MRKPKREMCVFTRQNVIKDPPFARLDLVSCRNLIIYRAPVLRPKLQSFHRALNPSGILMLGMSESVGARVELYRLIDRRFRIYEREPTHRQADRPHTLESALAF